MKFIKYSIMFFTAISLLGCMSLGRDMAINGMTQESVYERFFIHDNPAVGDRGFYISENKNMKGNGYTVTLKEIDNGLNVVAIEPENKSMINFEKLLWVTNDGWVKKAELRAYNKVYPLKVEGTGSDSYYRSVTFEKLPLAQKFESHGKTYSVKYIQTRQMAMKGQGEIFSGKFDGTTVSVELYDPSVPFGMVKAMMTGTIDVHPSVSRFLAVAMKAATPEIYSRPSILMDLYDATQIETSSWGMDFYYMGKGQ